VNDQVVLITGCSSGIGLAAAVAFAQRGATVVATMRNLDRSGDLRAALAAAGVGVDVDVMQLDVTDDTSVAAAVEAVVAQHGRIDVVVNNAGVGCDGTMEELTLNDFRDVLDANFFGVLRLCKAVMPAMRERGSGRLIAVSSMAGTLGQPFNDAYCASKFALEGLMESLHPVAATFGVDVCIVEPGPVTGTFVDSSTGAGARAADSPYVAVRERFSAVQRGAYEIAQTPQEIAAVLLDVATTPTPHLRYQTSDGGSRLIGVKIKDLTGERLTGLTRSWIE